MREETPGTALLGIDSILKTLHACRAGCGGLTGEGGCGVEWRL